MEHKLPEPLACPVTENMPGIALPALPNFPVVLLCGAGTLALEVAKLATQARFVVDIVDSDAEKIPENMFPMARNLFSVPEFTDLAEQCAIGGTHYIAILTHASHHSHTILSQALHSTARYIGMIGSREKRAPLFAQLCEQGMPKMELACVRCPIGLPIGAQSPEELAIAIVAEIIAAREGCLPRTVLPKDL
ncbi:MAG: XdhC family protein [Desulfovibrionaceae bacterium]